MRVCEPNRRGEYAVIEAEPGATFDGLPSAEVLDLLVRHGVVLLRGFSFSLSAFTALTDRFGERYRNNSSRNRQEVADRIQTVNLGRLAFALHPELSRGPDKPDLVWFGCAHAPPDGGQTLLADGIAIAEDLPPEIRAVCDQRSLRYRILLEADSPEAQEEGYQYSTLGHLVIQDYHAPILHHPKFQPEALAWGNFILFARYTKKVDNYPTFEDGSVISDQFCAAVDAVARRHTVAHQWQTGDVLMIDNTRFLHGRPALTEEQREKRVIWSRFGFLRADGCAVPGQA